MVLPEMAAVVVAAAQPMQERVALGRLVAQRKQRHMVRAQLLFFRVLGAVVGIGRLMERAVRAAVGSTSLSLERLR